MIILGSFTHSFISENKTKQQTNNQTNSAFVNMNDT